MLAFIVTLQRTFPEKVLRHCRMCMEEWGALG